MPRSSSRRGKDLRSTLATRRTSAFPPTSTSASHERRVGMSSSYATTTASCQAPCRRSLTRWPIGIRPNRVILFGVEAVDAAGRILRRQEFPREVSLGASGALYGLLSDNRFALFPGVVVSRDAYAAVGPFDAGLGNATDIEMWVRLFSRYGVRCVPRTISAYTAHAGSATQSTAFDGDAVAKLMEIFERARSTGVLSAETINRCQVRYIHSIILATAYLDLRSGDLTEGRKKMDLFDLPSVRSLGPSLAWMPVRLTFTVLVRCPTAVVRPFMSWLDRLQVVRRVRASGSHGRGRLRA